MKISLDFESYYSADYSLTNMTTTQYIYDPQFLVQGVGIAIDENDVQWFTGRNIATALASIDWNQADLIGHNLLFDGGILSFHYGYIPRSYIDTAAIARTILPFLKSHSLKNVSAYLELDEEKVSEPLYAVRGIRYPDKEKLASLGAYCRKDVRLTRGIYKMLRNNVTEGEYKLIDTTTRMFTQPRLHLNPERLKALIKDKEETRDKLVKNSGLSLHMLRSTQTLVDKLKALGVDPPMKPSPKNEEKMIYTFQRDLPDVVALTQHRDPKVRAIINARLEVMSSIDLNRAKRMLAVHDVTGGAFPIPLKHYGAHTGRWAGTDKLNAQNFSHGAIRECIVAPPHHRVCAVDLGQIEARFTAWLAEHTRLLAQFADPNVDVYSSMAAKLFNKKPEDIVKDERFIGKVLILSAGFGVGWKKLLYFFQTKRPDLKITPNEAHQYIETYRMENYPIVLLWKKLQEYLEYMITMEPGEEIQYKCLTFGNYYVRLPNDNLLMYPGLRYEEEEMADGETRLQIVYDHRGNTQKIYGGRFTENIIQALARTLIGTSMNTIQEEVIPIAAMAHDELITVPHVSQADDVMNEMIRIMTTAPSWAPDMPLIAEGAHAENYGEAK